METLTEKQTIIKVTELLEKKNRFAFVTYTRSSLFTAIGELKVIRNHQKTLPMLFFLG